MADKNRARWPGPGQSVSTHHPLPRPTWSVFSNQTVCSLPALWYRIWLLGILSIWPDFWSSGYILGLTFLDKKRNWFRRQVLTIVSIDFHSSSFFFYGCSFWPTSGKLPRLKICFRQYFSDFFLFSGFFPVFSASVRSRKPEPPLVHWVFQERPS